MAGRSKQYPEDFKADAVALIHTGPGTSVMEVAARLGVNHWTLRGWYRQSLMARKHKKKSPKVRSSDADAEGEASESTEERAARLERENAALRKKVAQLEMDRAILKKAAAFFAKESE